MAKKRSGSQNEIRNALKKFMDLVDRSDSFTFLMKNNFRHAKLIASVQEHSSTKNRLLLFKMSNKFYYMLNGSMTDHIRGIRWGELNVYGQDLATAFHDAKELTQKEYEIVLQHIRNEEQKAAVVHEINRMQELAKKHGFTVSLDDKK